MADAPNKGLKVVVVTPERAVLDVPADMVVLPMFDGERGILPGHAPFVGQLGPGELRIKRGTATTRYFIDGGFAQVTGAVVNVLTAKATPAEKITPEAVERERKVAESLAGNTPADRNLRNRSLVRAQVMAAVAKKN
jgi:F-type H+-transporting ATPase subunit epsilon